MIDISIVELDAHIAAPEFHLIGCKIRAIVSDDTVGDAIKVYNQRYEVYHRSGFSRLTGLASIYLVNLSTMTNRYFCLWVPPLSGPTMSSPQTTNGQVMGIVLRAVGGIWL